ncbi:MAG: FAD-binding protein [Candidatus Magnetoovum sp. WYHC-5]|nr:FAD-binding protein [Candidatus Magnetoovum sp. WYHC-5]
MKRLCKLLKDSICSTDLEDIMCYGYDASSTEGIPAAVVWPQTTDDVVTICKFAYANNYKIIPRGAGTGMTGGGVPVVENTILMSFEHMNRILEVDTANLNVIVEPGVINADLQHVLADNGYFYPPDPASLNMCTIGGNVAENAGGPRAVKYGVTRDYVMQLEAVLPDGNVIITGTKTAKSVVGYDLTRLLVGSEGTLATITKIRLKILTTPDGVVTMVAFFHDPTAAGKVVSKIMASCLTPRTLEFMDKYTLDAVKKYKNIGIGDDIQTLLLIELDGNIKAIADETETVCGVCRAFNGIIKFADSDKLSEMLWDIRRSASPALYNISPGKINDDIVVPINRVSDALGEIEKLSKSAGITVACFGHAGDGNLHVNILLDKNNEEMLKKAQKLKKDIFELTLSLEGSISGEHGIGITKAKFIDMELGLKNLDIMRGIKKLFDSKNILNPGKIFPS